MRFFGTRLPATGYEGPGGVFFISSEQPPHGSRAWTVRQLVGEGEIETVGEFCAYDRESARDIAKAFASEIKA